MKYAEGWTFVFEQTSFSCHEQEALAQRTGKPAARGAHSGGRHTTPVRCYAATLACSGHVADLHHPLCTALGHS